MNESRNGSERRAEKKLGVWTCTALVVGNMIGSGVFLLPASLAPFGGLSLVGWAVTAAGSLMLALVFARLAERIPNAGGPYAYTRAGFGEFAGFWIAWGYWIALWTGNAAIASAFASYLTVFFPSLRDRPLVCGLAAVAAVWTMTWINCRGIRSAGTVQLLTTIAKLVPLVAVATVGLLWIDGRNFVPLNPSGQSTFQAVSQVATLTLWSFLGLESATVPAGEVEHPRRTIPLATVLGTGIASVVYILSTAAVIGAVPRETLANSTAPFADAASAMWGGWAYYAVGVGAMVSCLGALNGWTLLQGRIPMAAARDGMFPARFGKLSARGVPAFAIVSSSVLMTAVLMLHYSGTQRLTQVFQTIILLATFCNLLAYAFCALCPFVLPGEVDRAESSRRRRVHAVLAGLSFCYAGWTVYGAGAETVFQGFLLLLAGLPVFAWLKRERGKKISGA